MSDPTLQTAHDPTAGPDAEPQTGHRSDARPGPWLSIIGIGEDGLPGLSSASRSALDAAAVVLGAPRHLSLAGLRGAGQAAFDRGADACADADTAGRGRVWPVPFDLGPLIALRGQRVAMLVTGDPFWHGAGSPVAERLEAGEWRAFPAPGVVSLIAARLGWRIEETRCLGLHAAPFERLRPVLSRGVRAICTVRDAAAVPALAGWLDANGYASVRIVTCEAMGGPRERIRPGADWPDIAAPVAVALDCADLAADAGLPQAAGLPDTMFVHDGQITRAAVRALTLAALGPRPGQLLWDVGAGSGSVSVEWCLAGGCAIAVEPRADRAANIARNADFFGVAHRLRIVRGPAPQALSALPAPDAIFVGGGGQPAIDAAVLAAAAKPEGPAAAGGSRPDLRHDGRGGSAPIRLVINAVTLETETALIALHASRGGRLMRVSLDEAAPLGRCRGWLPARPVVQWAWP